MRFLKVILGITGLICTLCASSSRAQALDDAFLRSTALIAYEKGANSWSTGTGFFLLHPTKIPNKGQLLLVTNKHVLPPEGQAKDILIRVSTRVNGQVQIRMVSVPIVGVDGRYLPTVRLHPAGWDVAAVNVTPAVVGNNIEGAWIPEDLLATPDRIKQEGITVGDEIFLLGYPNSIFDPRNASPILRMGVIATAPSEGYAFNPMLRSQFGLPDRIDGFLIDANVFPGSSGSVVILRQQPISVGPGGGAMLNGTKQIPYILGIVEGSIPISDSELGSTQRMGLGIVYSAEAIRAVVDSF